jgi:hypothetical protein
MKFSYKFNSFINGSTDICWALAAFSVFVILYKVGRTPWTGDQPIAQTNTDIYALGGVRAGKTVHALDRAANVIGANVIRMAKLRRMIWARHVELMWRRGINPGFWW